MATQTIEKKMWFLDVPMIVGIRDWCDVPLCCHCGYCEYRKCEDMLEVELEDGRRVFMTEEEWAEVTS
jgi:hypothetical protein